ncbi:MAG: M16 family metallopeptidase [Bdellovibrionales bacterium]
MKKYDRTVLKNGLTLVSELHPHTNAVSIGFGIRAGSIVESEAECGSFHFLEHLVFKATKKYSSFELVNILEEKGGDLNAFTSKEYTCYHSFSLAEDLEKAVDVLSQIVFQPKFTKKDFELEKDVVIQEISMSKDTPDDYIIDRFYELLYPKKAVGRPIFGTEESVRALKLSDLKKLHKDYYFPENVVVTATGNFDLDKLIQLLEKLTPKTKSGLKPKKLSKVKQKAKEFFVVEPRDLEQVHMLLSFPSSSVIDGINYPTAIINSYLGSGMNSVLFQKLREEQGLCYSVGSSFHPGFSTGNFVVSASCHPNQIDKLVASTMKEMRKIQKSSMSKKIVEKMQQQIRCTLLLGESEIESRMNAMLYDEIFRGIYRNTDKVVEGICSTEKKDIDAYLSKFLDTNAPSLLLLGKVSEKQEAKIRKNLKPIKEVN